MDIRGMVMQGLHAAFPEVEVYGEEVEQGFAPPCFVVRVLSGGVRAYPGGRRREDCSLAVRYFPLDRPEGACAEMGPQLAAALEVLPENAARANRMEWELQEGVLHFFADYSVFSLRVEEQETMGSIAIQEGVGT